MLVFAKRMLKDKYKTLIFYSLGSIALIEMYVSLFPSIQTQAGNVDKMIKSFPPELFKAMNMDPSTLSFSNMQSYISSEYMSFLWPIVAIILAISLANYISVGEVEKRTSEVLLSLPASRKRIFLERYFTGLIILAVFSAISFCSVIPLAIMHNAPYVTENYITAAIGSFIFTMACYSLATLSSTIFSEKGRSSMTTSGIIILMYVLFIMSTLVKSVANLKYLSIFNYFSGSELLAKNHYPDNMLVVLGLFSIVLFAVSLMIYQRRDMSV